MGNQINYDGYFNLAQSKLLLKKVFCSEKQMCDYIEIHIQEFCSDLLGEQLESYQREFRFNKSVYANNSQRIDFVITTKSNSKIVLECKNPKYTCENYSAIGQLMAYKSLCKHFEILINRFILVTTVLDFATTQILLDNQLGIELIGFSDTKSLTLCQQKPTQ